ncbi:MAG TPA: hypothetical protein VFC46_07045, partial [Humisphaera sp.]|nr:hypothetical protein [Humisphaera sp.]
MLTAGTEALLAMAPIPALRSRLRAQAPSAGFDPSRPIRLSRSPGRLDVMGGIADYTGSMVCQLTLDRAAGIALQERADRTVCIVRFDPLDEGNAPEFQITLDAIASHTAQTLRRVFDVTDQCAARIVGCIFVLHDQRFINLIDPAMKGFTIALCSTVPAGVGVASSAAIEVATMMNLRDHFALMRPYAGRSLRIANLSAMNPIMLAELCQTAENKIAGIPCGVVNQMTSCWGERGMLLRMMCQPHELLPPLAIPPGVRFVGINSGVKRDVAGAAYVRTRCA